MRVLWFLGWAQNVLFSIFWTIYLHSILHWQHWPIDGFYIAPDSINAAFVTHWIAIPAFLYILTQLSAMAFHPPGAVYATWVAFLSSMLPVGEIATAFGSGMTPLQWYTAEIGVFSCIAELLCPLIASRLLTRSVVGDVMDIHGFNHR